RVKLIDRLETRITRIKMKRIDDDADAVPVDFVDDLFSQVERLARAISLAKEFKSQTDAIRLRNVGQLIQNSHRLRDDLGFRCSLGQLAGHDDDVRTSYLSSHS